MAAARKLHGADGGGEGLSGADARNFMIQRAGGG